MRLRPRQRTDGGAAADAVEGRRRCTARRNAYGLLPAARGLDAGGVAILR